MVDVCYTPDLLAALADVPPSAWLNTVQCIRGRIHFSEAFVNKLKTAVHPSGVLVLEKPDGRLELVVALQDGSFRVFDFGRDAEAISVDDAPHATLDVREEYKPDRIVTSFFETDRDNPWIQVVEERREEHDRN